MKNKIEATNLSSLPKLTTHGKKRVGRGYGSGKGGHTSSRGAKGQLVRGSVPMMFTGTKSKKSFVKRLPFLRGKDKFNVLRGKPVVVGTSELNIFKKDDVVNLESLVKMGIVGQQAMRLGVKILSKGEVKIALQIAVPVSKGALVEIKKAGGDLVKSS